MKPISAALAGIRSRLEEVRATSAAAKRQRIVAGNARWGWPLDAECDFCGDRGRWPGANQTYCSCSAGDELRRREAAEERDRARAEEWRLSGVPRRFGDFRIETAPNEFAAAQVAAWIDERAWSREGRNLFLFGPVGTGKTGLTIGALWAIHQLGAAGGIAFWSVPDLLDQMRPGAPEPDPMPHVKSVGMLVLDDMGVEKASPWVQERLYVLIDARYGSELPTIVTSNRGLLDLADTLGERIVSRLAQSIAPVLVDGPDRRRG